MKCPKCETGEIIEVESPDSPNGCRICDCCLYELDKDEFLDIYNIENEQPPKKEEG